MQVGVILYALDAHREGQRPGGFNGGAVGRTDARHHYRHALSSETADEQLRQRAIAKWHIAAATAPSTLPSTLSPLGDPVDDLPERIQALIDMSSFSHPPNAAIVVSRTLTSSQINDRQPSRGTRHLAIAHCVQAPVRVDVPVVVD